jgi:hypothetical protein
VTHGRPWELPYSFPWQSDPVKPDIVNFSKRTFGEIKPLSISGVKAGYEQIAKYEQTFAPLGLIREPWPDLPQFTWVYAESIMTIIMYFNFNGIIFYTDVIDWVGTGVLIGAATGLKNPAQAATLANASSKGLSGSSSLRRAQFTVQSSREASVKTTVSNATMAATISKF